MITPLLGLTKNLKETFEKNGDDLKIENLNKHKEKKTCKAKKIWKRNWKEKLLKIGKFGRENFEKKESSKV